MHLFPEGTYSLMSVLTAEKILGADLICTRSQISPYHAIAAAPTDVMYFPASMLTHPGLLQETLRLDVLNRLLTLIDSLTRQVPIWQLHCTPTLEAARLTYQQMAVKDTIHR